MATSQHESLEQYLTERVRPGVIVNVVPKEKREVLVKRIQSVYRHSSLPIEHHVMTDYILILDLIERRRNDTSIDTILSFELSNNKVIVAQVDMQSARERLKIEGHTVIDTLIDCVKWSVIDALETRWSIIKESTFQTGLSTSLLITHTPNGVDSGGAYAIS